MGQRRRCVVLTRAHADNAALRLRLSKLGFCVMEQPTAVFVDILSPQRCVDAVVALLSVDVVAFTSPHAVSAWHRQVIPAAWHDAISRGVLVAAVGDRTASALKRLGIAAISPQLQSQTGEQLAEIIKTKLSAVANPCVLLAQAEHARPELGAALRAQGATTIAFALYANNAPPAPRPQRLRRLETADLIYFAAPSAADRLLGWHPALAQRRIVAIGPTTAQELWLRHGLRAVAVAQSPNLTDVVAAIVKASENQ